MTLFLRVQISCGGREVRGRDHDFRRPSDDDPDLRSDEARAEEAAHNLLEE